MTWTEMSGIHNQELVPISLPDTVTGNEDGNMEDRENFENFIIVTRKSQQKSAPQEDLKAHAIWKKLDVKESLTIAERKRRREERLGHEEVRENTVPQAPHSNAYVIQATVMRCMLYEVRCGALVAKMHVKLFRCPGINERCIEFGKEMITPKEFTVKANRTKQKDWKGSIKVGRTNLRYSLALSNQYTPVYGHMLIATFMPSIVYRKK
ncbi:SAND domain protein [Ostertagia ostertagi]